DKVSSLLSNFQTQSINLDTKINDEKTLRNSINVAYGKMDDIEKIISFLQSYVNFTQMEEFKFDQLVRFSPNNFLTAMKFAILYEGSLNSQRVQEYTAPLVSRMQSLVE
ncbi:ATPase, partial [Listeria monocytogenes]|nr:ATPase [Listeria monocytogenes]